MLETYNFSNEFQDLILASIIRHPQEFFSRRGVVKPDYFAGTAANEIAKLMVAYEEKYHRTPSFSSLFNMVVSKHERNENMLKQCTDYVRKLRGVDTYEWEVARDLALKFARERAIKHALGLVADDYVKGKEVKRDLVALFEEAVAVGFNEDDVGVEICPKDIVRVVSDYVNCPFGIQTGYKQLDDIWFKGWQPGWLVVPLAPPKRHKSMFCVNLALNIASHRENRKKPCDVIYYACELSEELTMLRALQNMTGRTQKEINKEPKPFIEQAITASGRLHGRIFFKTFKQKSATIADIRTHAKMLIEQEKLNVGAIFIDYAETVQSSITDKSIPEYRRSAAVYTEARLLGGELGCTVIMPDRCKAEVVEQAVPDINSFQGAFEKAGIVDVAIGLCALPDEHLKGQVRYFIFLNRHGEEGGHFVGQVDSKICRMSMDDVITVEQVLQEFPKRANKPGGAKGTKAPPKGKTGVAMDEDEDESF